MAIIQKIRDKYAKVAGGVIVLALVGFVLMDATSGGRGGGGLFGSGTTVAKVGGIKIDAKEYDALVNMQEEQMRSQNRPTDEASNAQLRDQALHQLIMDKLTTEINEKLGITVSEGELKEMMNPANPDPMVRQAFTNPQTGEYLPEQAAGAISQYEKTKDPKMKAQWEDFKSQIAASKVNAKLNAMLAGSYYTPKFVLDDQNEGRSNYANVSYVSLPYTLITDDKVKVTDEDVTKYIAARKSSYEVKEESRTVDYISFSIAPSNEDSNRVRTDLESLKGDLAATTEAEAFVRRNSSAQIPVAYYSEEQLQQMQLSEAVNGAAIGGVVGPVSLGTDMAIVKVLSKATLPDSVKVRHILVMTKRAGQQGAEELRTEAQAQARMDSLIAKQKAGTPFADLIKEYSDDNIEQNPTGEYELSLAQRSGFTKEFGDFAFSGAGVGATKVVKVESGGYAGLHYIEILKKGSKMVPSTELAVVVKPLNADNNTYNTLYAKASQFATKVNTAPKDFEKEATAAGIQMLSASGLNRNSAVVQGLGASSDLVRWAYGAKLNDISPTYTIGGNRIVVARLSEINAPGLLKPTGNMKTGIENIIRQEKKAKMLLDANKGKTSLADIATANQVQVSAADSITFAASSASVIGNEPKVIGYAFNKNFKENAMSPGIAGIGSLYFITVTSRTKAPEGPRDLKTERQMNDAMMRGRASQMIMDGLLQAADVKDLRYKVYTR